MGELLVWVLERLKRAPISWRAWRAGRRSSRAQVARRLQHLLNELNRSYPYDPWNVEKMAATIGEQSPDYLERCFDAEVSPSFDLLMRIAKEFSVNPDWLQFGHRAPFDLDDGSGFFAENLYGLISTLNPLGIFFIRSDGPIGESCIVLELSDWNYRKLDYFWHVSDHVGGTGTTQIVSLHKLVLLLRASVFITRCCGRQVPQDVANALINGRLHPGYAALKAGLRSDWWDELDAALDPKWDAQCYLDRHGLGFVAAQRIVRDESARANVD